MAKTADLAEFLMKEVFFNFSAVLSYGEMKERLARLGFDTREPGFHGEFMSAVKRLVGEGSLDFNCVQHKVSFRGEHWCLLKFWLKG